jgi:cytoskeleton protein RodZ
MAVEAGGIGARLRAGREKLGLTVLQVAERIHTDPKIVEAIEAENFEALGAPVYARGHIGHYAELVGESGSELNQLYSNVSKVAQPDLTRIVKAPAGTNSNKLVAPALLVIAVFAVAGAIWWVSALSKKKPQLSDTHVVGEETPATAAPGSESATPAPGTAPAGEPTQAGASATPADRGPPPGATPIQARPGPQGSMAMQARPAPQGSMAMQGGPVTAGATSSPSRSGSAGSGGATSASSRTGAAGSSASAQALSAGSNGSTAASAPQRPGAASSTRTASAPPAPTHRTATAQTRTADAQTRVASSSPPPAQTSSAPALAAATQPRAKNQSQVTLRYSADSWTEVYDASGARLFYDVGAANSVQTVVGTPPLRVVLGNASGVAVEYNGHSKPIAKLSRPDGSVQFSINRSGQVVRAKPVADGG